MPDDRSLSIIFALLNDYNSLMKLIFPTSLFVYFLFIPLFLQAQEGHKNHWYFGKGAGLDFSSGSPVSVANSTMIVEEGCVTHSDENGDLLFYSNGNNTTSNGIVAVWNRNHNIMPNGSLFGLTGNSTPMQSSLVVPMPGSTTKYYLFTLDGYENYNSPNYKGLTYSIIDMTLDGGLGDVTEKATPLIIPSAPILCEQIMATKHANGIDYWVILHESGYINQDNTNQFIRYRISPSGISNPESQYIGIENSAGMQSTMQISAQGDKLTFNWEIFDFDNETGMLSNPRATGSSWGYREFSKSGRFLYVAMWSEGLFQYDTEAPNIAASVYQISSHPRFSQLQIAPDGKIYISMDFYNGVFQPYLSVINNPDVQGVGCGFVHNQLELASGVCVLGLPNFIDYDPKMPQNGLSDNKIDQQLFISPNPASTTITVKYNDINSYPLITIFDLQGKLILSHTCNMTGEQIDISSVQPGSYIAMVEIDHSVQWMNLVIQ